MQSHKPTPPPRTRFWTPGGESARHFRYPGNPGRIPTTGFISHPGVPPGVINIVFGTGPRVGEALVSHPEVPLISFTGSQPTAERITQLSAPHCKKLSLELGGKNPAIIFEDANLEECIPATVRSSFANQVWVPLTTALSGWIYFITVQSPGGWPWSVIFLKVESMTELLWQGGAPGMVMEPSRQVPHLKSHNFYSVPAWWNHRLRYSRPAAAFIYSRSCLLFPAVKH